VPRALGGGVLALGLDIDGGGAAENAAREFALSGAGEVGDIGLANLAGVDGQQLRASMESAGVLLGSSSDVVHGVVSLVLLSRDRSLGVS
jgi:hypothetical protein